VLTRLRHRHRSHGQENPVPPPLIWVSVREVRPGDLLDGNSSTEVRSVREYPVPGSDDDGDSGPVIDVVLVTTAGETFEFDGQADVQVLRRSAP
jgi:hypothetical protein